MNTPLFSVGSCWQMGSYLHPYPSQQENEIICLLIYDYPKKIGLRSCRSVKGMIGGRERGT